mgnify:CR=1 FL=1
MVIAFGAFQEAGQSLRFAHPMFSLRRLRVNANVETKHICFIVSPLVIALGAFQEAGQSLRFARPMFSLRRLRVNAKRRNKTFVKQIA